MEFKDMLVYLRKRNHLTQAEAAKHLRIPRSTLASYETGIRQPDLVMLNNIADFYNVNMDTLLCKAPAPAKEEKTAELSAVKRKLCEIIYDLPDEQAKKLLDFLS